MWHWLNCLKCVPGQCWKCENKEGTFYHADWTCEKAKTYSGYKFIQWYKRYCGLTSWWNHNYSYWVPWAWNQEKKLILYIITAAKGLSMFYGWSSPLCFTLLQKWETTVFQNLFISLLSSPNQHSDEKFRKWACMLA